MNLLKSGVRESHIFQDALIFLKRFLERLKEELAKAMDSDLHTNIQTGGSYCVLLNLVG